MTLLICSAKQQQIDGIERIRFTSPHPADMSDRVIDAMATCPKVAPYLHLPLQSGANSVLAQYGTWLHGRTIAACWWNACVQAIPGLALSTDIIVGFPGEEEVDFRATYDFMNTSSLRFRVHV